MLYINKFRTFCVKQRFKTRLHGANLSINSFIYMYLTISLHPNRFVNWANHHMAYTCLIVLDPEIPFTLPVMKGISGTDANYKVIK